VIRGPIDALAASRAHVNELGQRPTSGCQTGLGNGNRLPLLGIEKPRTIKAEAAINKT
jgi:hypothetical protein